MNLLLFSFFVYFISFIVLWGFDFTSADFTSQILCGLTYEKNACEIKKFWHRKTKLQPEELYCFTSIFMLNGKQLFVRSLNNCFLSQSWSTIKKMAAINVTSLNKTDGQCFPQKYLFTLRMITKIFINVWLELLQTFHDHDTERSEFREEWLCPHIDHRVADWFQ